MKGYGGLWRLRELSSTLSASEDLNVETQMGNLQAQFQVLKKFIGKRHQWDLLC